MTRRGINKIPKSFSCPGDCKELSKKTKRSIYDSIDKPSQDQAMADPTADLRQQLADHEADKDKRDTNVPLTLATVEDCRRKQGDGTVGARAVVS